MAQSTTSDIIDATNPTEASASPESCLPRLRLLTSIMRSAKLCTRSARRFCSSSSYLQKTPNTQPSQSRSLSSSVRKAHLLTLPCIPTPKTQKTEHPHPLLFFRQPAITPPASTSSLNPSPCEASFLPILFKARTSSRWTTGWTGSRTGISNMTIVPTIAIY